MDKKVLLMILDGWGEGKHDRSNAIYTQGTPNLDKLRAKYPVSFLKACGEDVGLPEGQMGNSEVGHLNIGAGRIVYQDLQHGLQPAQTSGKQGNQSSIRLCGLKR